MKKRPPTVIVLRVPPELAREIEAARAAHVESTDVATSRSAIVLALVKRGLAATTEAR